MKNHKSRLKSNCAKFFMIFNLQFFNYTNLFKNNFIIFIIFNNLNSIFNLYFYNYFRINYSLNFKKNSIVFLDIYKRTFGDGYYYIRGLFIIFFIDSCVTDDEPL